MFDYTRSPMPRPVDVNNIQEGNGTLLEYEFYFENMNERFNFSNLFVKERHKLKRYTYVVQDLL